MNLTRLPTRARIRGNTQPHYLHGVTGWAVEDSTKPRDRTQRVWFEVDQDQAAELQRRGRVFGGRVRRFCIPVTCLEVIP